MYFCLHFCCAKMFSVHFVYILLAKMHFCTTKCSTKCSAMHHPFLKRVDWFFLANRLSEVFISQRVCFFTKSLHFKNQNVCTIFCAKIHFCITFCTLNCNVTNRFQFYNLIFFLFNTKNFLLNQLSKKNLNKKEVLQICFL